MFSSYEYRDPLALVEGWIGGRPNRGRGEWQKLSKHLQISSTLMSQIRNRTRTLSMEHGAEIAVYIDLSESETRYFLLLVEYERAGSARLKNILKAQIDEHRKNNIELKQRLKTDAKAPVLAEEQKARFYSDWSYSAIRNLVAVDPALDVARVADRLGLDRERTKTILEFLLECDLLRREGGVLLSGPQKTHVPSDSPWVSSHHRNWRLKAMEKMSRASSNELFYTGPMSLSRDAAEVIRAHIPGFLEEVYSIVGPSQSEVVRCLNIDWFNYEK
jgi:uncharacterized protein (TIGR02147 family)